MPAYYCSSKDIDGSFDMVKRRKSKVPPPPTECPLSHCMRVLAGAWTAHVIWYLQEGERCFTELQTDIAKVSAKIPTCWLPIVVEWKTLSNVVGPPFPLKA